MSKYGILGPNKLQDSSGVAHDITTLNNNQTMIIDGSGNVTSSASLPFTVSKIESSATSASIEMKETISEYNEWDAGASANLVLRGDDGGDNILQKQRDIQAWTSGGGAINAISIASADLLNATTSAGRVFVEMECMMYDTATPYANPSRYTLNFSATIDNATGNFSGITSPFLINEKEKSVSDEVWAITGSGSTTLNVTYNSATHPNNRTLHSFYDQYIISNANLANPIV